MSWIPQNQKALVYGFGPFGGIRRNPSEAIVEALRAHRFARAAVDFEVLPVSYERAPALLLRRNINDFDAIVGFGVGYGFPGFSVERTAQNVVDCASPDCDGRLAEHSIVSAAAPMRLECTLDVNQIVTAIRNAGVPATVSDNAGTFLCNLSYFRLLESHPEVPALFIHVPAATEDVASSGDFVASLPLSLMVNGATAALGAVFEQVASHARRLGSR